MEDLDQAQTRLDHIRTVAPILGALRTISLGSWKAALKQRASVQRYAEQLTAILPSLLPHLPSDRKTRAASQGTEAPQRVAALVIGSERGLCGRYNAAAAELAGRYLDEQRTAGFEVELMALGTRVDRILRRRLEQPIWSGTLSIAALPPYRTAFELTSRWLERYEAYDLTAVDLVYNAYRGTGHYQPTVARLIPAPLPERVSTKNAPWPPVIVETDPLSLFARIVEQQVATKLYEYMLDAAAAEHSTRFQIMEGATQNADRLIVELTMAVQTARQHQITQEMQELASGAGLLED